MVISPHFQGYLEAVKDGCVSGWTSDVAGQPAPVTIHVNGTVAATLAANQSRPWTCRQSGEIRHRFQAQLRLVLGDRVEVFHGITGHPLRGGVRRVVDPGWRPRICLVSPVKQEAPYLLEWIAYHRALGVELFLLGDNGGTDQTSELLHALDAAGLVHRLDWLGEENFQVRFNLDAVSRMCGVADVCSITDVDEFLRPLGGRPDIPAAVAEIFARPEVSAAGLSYALYGSSGRVEPGTGLVIERFSRRAPDDSAWHKGVKSMVRPEQLVGMKNPHVVLIAEGQYVDDRGDLICWGPRPAMTQSISWNSLRVDHFVIKSRQEFEIKRRRGRADQPRGVMDRDEEFFPDRDSNEILDPVPEALVSRTKAELRQLQDHIKI